MNQVKPKTKLIANKDRPFELGLYTFVDDGKNVLTGEEKPPAKVIANLMETIKLADEVGLDVFAIGEHHREDFMISSPEVILGAAAAVTKNIRLSTAVTVLSSDDPVRVFEKFATVDLLSNGRAEIMAGRGSFIESFPLFGYDLKDYNELFEEKLDLLNQLLENKVVSWSGTFRASLENVTLYPRPAQKKIPLWIAVGGTPESAMRAAGMGAPMALAIIGGEAQRFAAYFDLYRRSAIEQGQDPDYIPLSINSHGFIADTSKDAVDSYYPFAQMIMNRIGKERGWPPASRAQLETQSELHGSDFVGNPEEIIEKILYQNDLFKHQRFLLSMGNNAMDHKKMLHAIELYGTKVAPVVRKEIAKRNKAR